MHHSKPANTPVYSFEGSASTASGEQLQLIAYQDGRKPIEQQVDDDSMSKSDLTSSPSPVKSSKHHSSKLRDPPLVINISYTQYDVIH